MSILFLTSLSNGVPYKAINCIHQADTIEAFQVTALHIFQWYRFSQNVPSLMRLVYNDCNIYNVTIDQCNTSSYPWLYLHAHVYLL